MPFVPIVTAATAAMLERWQRIAEHGKPLDLQREMADLTRAIILRVLFGDIAAAEGGQALDFALEHASRRLWSPLGWLEVPTSGNRQYRRALRTVDGFLSGTIVRARRQGPLPGRCFRSCWIRAAAGQFLVARHSQLANDKTSTGAPRCLATS